MFKFVQLPPCPLETFISSSEVTFDVSGFLYNDGVTPVDPADIGDICYATLEPRTERAELISFTIDSVTEAGVATITAVRGLSQKHPYGLGGASFDHQAGSNLVISNNPGLLDKFAIKGNDETITGTWTFNVAPVALGATRATEEVIGNVKLSAQPLTDLGVATITIADPAVISKVGHNLIEGDSVKFTTDGSLPTGITTAGEYFVIAAGLTADAFQISLTIGGDAVATSGSQSGVHTLFRTSPVAVSTDDPVLPTQDEKDALGGANIAPSETNKLITEKDLEDPTFKAPQVLVFTGSGTWTKDDGLKYVIVEGSAGGGGSNDSNNGSGGGGGYFKKLILASALASTETVTVGASGVSADPGTPTAGGTTSFGSHATANGGGTGGSGIGGTATGGDVNINGGDGRDGSTGTGGNYPSAGSSFYGNGTNVPTGYGQGGAGVNNGRPGIVIITEYYV